MKLKKFLKNINMPDDTDCVVRVWEQESSIKYGQLKELADNLNIKMLSCFFEYSDGATVPVFRLEDGFCRYIIAGDESVPCVYLEPKGRYYLSGPITGVEDYLKVFTYYEEMLTNLYGITVINPAKSSQTLPESTRYWEYIDKDIELMRMCEGIILMPGWDSSVGARFEKSYAKIREMRILGVTESGTLYEVGEEDV